MNPKAWKHADTASLIRMYRADVHVQKIASSLGRSRKAIANKISHLGLSRRGRVRFSPSSPPVIVSRISIPHRDVPRFYEAGWRFIGFDSALCIFEWRGFGKPRWPVVGRAVSRELEAA